tara:strand:+ start:724 stop:1086 length:363 start_codon:yes stop_codon:yes gene_type:complete
MKLFQVNNKIVQFGSSAQENSNLVTEYKESHPGATWFHLTNRSSSHAFYLGDGILGASEINIIGNILLRLSNDNGKNHKITICQLKNVKVTKTPGLVNITNEKNKRIQRIKNFDSTNYKN